MPPTTRPISAKDRIYTWSRMEWISDFTLDTVNKTYTLKTPDFPMQRWLAGLRFEFQGRITMPASSGPSATLAEAPFSLFDSIQLHGFYVPDSAEQMRVDLSMPLLRAFNNAWYGSLPTSEPAALSRTNDATNDIGFVVDCPLCLPNLHWAERKNTLFDTPNFRNLELKVKYGDILSAFSGQTNAPTFSAYGSTTGSPILKIYGLFVEAGAGVLTQARPIQVWRYKTDVDIATTASAKKLYQLPTGYNIASVLMRAGVSATTVTSGNKALASLSDTALAELKLMLGQNRPIRHVGSFRALRQDAIANRLASMPTGYALFDFVTSGTMKELLRTQKFILGPSSEIDLNVTGNVTGATNGLATFAVEELKGQAVWPVSR